MAKGNGSVRQRRKIDPRADFQSAVGITEGPDSQERDAAVGRMEVIASSDGGYATSLCLLRYCSPSFVPDPGAAVDWAIRGMELGDSGSARWLEYFLLRGDGPAVSDDEPPAALGRGWFRAPRTLVEGTVLDVLLSATGTDSCGYTCFEESANIHGGFEDATCRITPSDGRRQGSILHKPTGFELSWADEVYDEARMNMPLSLREAQGVLLACIESAISAIGRGGSPGSSPIREWSGHPDAVVAREEDIRRALALPVREQEETERILKVDVIRLTPVSEGGEETLSFYRGRRLNVDGNDYEEWGPAEDRLFYAACLVPRADGAVYGPANSDGHGWRIEAGPLGGPMTVCSGSVLPPFMDPIISAIRGIGCWIPGVESLMNGLSGLRRAPVGPRPPAAGDIDQVVICRHRRGCESAGTFDAVDREELCFTRGDRDAMLIWNYCRDRTVLMKVKPTSGGARTVSKVLRMFEGFHDLGEDPACPWWIDVYCPEGVTRVSGDDAVGLMAAVQEASSRMTEGMDAFVRDSTDGMLVPDRFRRIFIFDGVGEDEYDYYGLRHERRRCLRRVSRIGAEGRRPRRPLEVRGGRQDEGARIRRSRPGDEDVSPDLLQRLLRLGS